MSKTVFRSAVRARRSRLYNAALAVASVASLAAIEHLHDHACTGDGCVLCLAAGSAHMLLGLCLCAAVAQPVLRAIVGMLPVYTTGFVATKEKMRFAGVFWAKAVETPVAMGVRLLI